MGFSTLQEWLTFQQGINPKEIDLRLERVQSVYDKLQINIPEKNVFLIGGTNGKGTTTSILEQLFHKNGYKTGAFTSPHLNRYNERVRISLSHSSDQDWISAFKIIEGVRDDIPLTYFEFSTLAAFQILSDFGCDAWFIEVGLGGRLDATNIIDPSVSILTNIAMDHEEWLGDSIEEIAQEKVGIAKKNKPLIFGDVVAMSSIEEGCNTRKAELRRKGHEFNAFVDQNQFSFKGANENIKDIFIPKSWGDGESDNLATSLAAMEANAEFFPSKDFLQQVIDDFEMPGRFELHEMNRSWILDVAHNPSAAQNLRQRINRSDLSSDYSMIFSMMKDKPLEPYLHAFKDLVKTWIVCEMETDRSFRVEQIEKKMNNMGFDNVLCARSPLDAIKTLEKNVSISNNVIVSGSFELVGPIRDFLLKSQRKI
ncbi:MAG: Mur ligase family protein [Gammaproteobacteria bacterium]|nr:Mur ligase family protein [Gammaproteobacteria bacterium]